jgi:hypothetical protein
VRERELWILRDRVLGRSACAGDVAGGEELLRARDAGESAVATRGNGGEIGRQDGGGCVAGRSDCSAADPLRLRLRGIARPVVRVATITTGDDGEDEDDARERYA